MLKFATPLLLFVVVVGFLAVGLERDPKLVPSPLIGKPFPSFELSALDEPSRTISNHDLTGKTWILNVWASWCVACRQEHPLLVEMAERGAFNLLGLNYKDERDAARQWLAARGDPYRFSISDLDGRLGLDLGVYGVPETFVVDRNGIIRYKFIGPLDATVVEQELMPVLQQYAGAQP